MAARAWSDAASRQRRARLRRELGAGKLRACRPGAGDHASDNVGEVGFRPREKRQAEERRLDFGHGQGKPPLNASSRSALNSGLSRQSRSSDSKNQKIHWNASSRHDRDGQVDAAGACPFAELQHQSNRQHDIASRQRDNGDDGADRYGKDQGKGRGHGTTTTYATPARCPRMPWLKAAEHRNQREDHRTHDPLRFDQRRTN